MKKKIIIISAALLLVATFYLSCVSYTDYKHVSISNNLITGEKILDTIPGITISYPWVQIVRLDKRPFRICVSSSSKNMVCGLYSFDYRYWKDFIELEGIHYYWMYNRISYNSGHSDEYRGLVDILKGYVLDNKKYKFIKYHDSDVEDV